MKIGATIVVHGRNMIKSIFRSVSYKSVLLLILLFNSNFINSDSFFNQKIQNYTHMGSISDRGLLYKVDGNQVLIKVDTYSIDNHVETFTFNNIAFDENGFGYISLFEKNFPIIYGSKFLLIINDESQLAGHRNSNINSDSLDIPTRVNTEVLKTNIDHITCSSFLTEGNVKYNTFSLDKYLGIRHWHSTKILGFNKNVRPWVEGVHGSGIGEILTISFKKPSSNIVVVNGYVDRNKKELYRDNNRVKTGIIKSADDLVPFEFEYHFEDYVKFDEINFPRKATKVIFEIKEVYPGRKWDDTCITALLTREPSDLEIIEKIKVLDTTIDGR